MCAIMCHMAMRTLTSVQSARWLPVRSRKPGPLCTVTLSFFLAAALCQGQGTFHITFDYPVPQPRGTAVLTNHYSEAGMSFTPIPPSTPANWFVRQGGGGSGYPENGTTCLQGTAFSTLSFSFDDGSLFNMLSVDLA